jgi:hypothetical protein
VTGLSPSSWIASIRPGTLVKILYFPTGATAGYARDLLSSPREPQSKSSICAQGLVDSVRLLLTASGLGRSQMPLTMIQTLHALYGQFCLFLVCNYLIQLRENFTSTRVHNQDIGCALKRAIIHAVQSSESTLTRQDERVDESGEPLPLPLKEDYGVIMASPPWCVQFSRALIQSLTVLLCIVKIIQALIASRLA